MDSLSVLDNSKWWKKYYIGNVHFRLNNSYLTTQTSWNRFKNKKDKQLNVYPFTAGIHQHNLINALNQSRLMQASHTCK